MNKSLITLFILTAVFWCQYAQGENYGREKCVESSGIGYPNPVSMISLIANPEKFDRKWLSFSGYVGGVNSMDLFFIHPSMESGKMEIIPEAIVGSHASKYKEIVPGKYVFISAIFTSGPYQFDTASFGFGVIDKICDVSTMTISK